MKKFEDMKKVLEQADCDVLLCHEDKIARLMEDHGFVGPYKHGFDDEDTVYVSPSELMVLYVERPLGERGTGMKELNPELYSHPLYFVNYLTAVLRQDEDF